MKAMNIKMRCSMCKFEGTTDNPACMMIGCKHFFCFHCVKLLPYGPNAHGICVRECSVCAFRSNYVQLPESIFDPVAGFEDNHRCIECERDTSEQDMQLCTTCQKLEFESLEDVKKYALCSTCAIKTHLRRGHHTVDYFPYVSAFNFSSNFEIIGTYANDLNNLQEKLDETFFHFRNVSRNVAVNLNNLIDVAQRSKSTGHQLAVFEKMQMFVNKSKKINIDVNDEIIKQTVKLEHSLNEIKDWARKKETDCVDRSKIIHLPVSDNQMIDLTEK